MEDFRKRLIYLRTTNNLTQKQLADLLNIERSTLSSYEIGRRYPWCAYFGQIGRYI